MFTIEGKYATAQIYASIVDEGAQAQILRLCNQPFAAESRIAIMPDVHEGKGCTIGTTLTIREAVVPSMVGVDIGCGMRLIALDADEIEYERLDAAIRECVPSGFSIRDEPHAYADTLELDALACNKRVNIARALASVGTLGGGNHFIEVEKDAAGKLYLVIHTGSRQLGLQIAGHYQKLAEGRFRKGKQQAELVQEYKRSGREKEIQEALKRLQKPPDMDIAYLEGDDMLAYLHDMGIAQAYARLNRAAIGDTLLQAMGWRALDQFETVHNYIDLEARILRKGAVSAKAGERLLIPMNMRDGSLLAVGRGNDAWNQSAPHGAGRIMSRSQAKKALDMETFRESMEGIFTTSVGLDTLDEAPGAYKPMEAIVEQVGETVEIQSVLKPVYNFKAGEER